MVCGERKFVGQLWLAVLLAFACQCVCRGAQMAELVDALASGASGLLVVEVRVFFWAPTPNYN